MRKGTPKRLMLFEAACFGHHATYLRILIEAWARRGDSCQLVVVVSPEFAANHGEVMALGEASGGNRLRIVPFSDEEHRVLTRAPVNFTPPLREVLNGRPNPHERPYQSWQLMSRCAARLGASRVLAMYFDSCLLAAAAGLTAPCPVSGIYFRPSFHYPIAADAAAPDLERLQRMQEKFILARALDNPGIERLFCLDPAAAAALRGSGRRVTYLPDPVEPVTAPASSAAEIRTALGIERGRTVLLSFGAVSPRKGVERLLEALAMIDGDLAARTCLLLVGPLKSQDSERLTGALTRLARAQPRLQVVQRSEHVPESEVGRYFAAADLVLATYQRHVGSSGVVLLAAAHGRPVLAQDYGRIGVMVRDYGLGACVDSTDARAVADAVAEVIRSGWANQPGDAEKRSAFLAAHSPQVFASTLLDALSF